MDGCNLYHKREMDDCINPVLGLSYWGCLTANTVFMGIVDSLKIVWQRESNNVRGAFTG